jgi:clan AA aspartic protease
MRKEQTMGTVKTEITLKNVGDVLNARKGLIAEAAVHAVTVEAIVDTGASTIIITEDVRQRLGLELEERQPINFANGAREICGITEPVQVRWKDRWTACPAIVTPGAKRILMGAIPLEAMDLIIHPKEQELAYAHGESWEAMAL